MGSIAAFRENIAWHPASMSWDQPATGAPSGLAAGLLDALSISALVVDAEGAVRLASEAATEMLRRPGSATILLPARPGADGAARLTARHREDAIVLRRLIAAAAEGGHGGSLRLHPSDAEGLDSMQVVVITPLPGGKSGAGLALVKIEDLVHRPSPSASLLGTLFGFSRSESGVALGLVGGASAEEVAHNRGVAIDTVRGQIRAILRKSETANLRSFERLMATIATLGTEPAHHD